MSTPVDFTTTPSNTGTKQSELRLQICYVIRETISFSIYMTFAVRFMVIFVSDGFRGMSQTKQEVTKQHHRWFQKTVNNFTE